MAKRKKISKPVQLMAKPKGLNAKQAAAYEAALAQSGYEDQWTPKGPGDVLFGKLLAVREFDTKYGEARAMTLESDEGTFSIIMGTVLGAAFDKLKPKLGSNLCLLFKGTKDTGKGNPAKLFALSLVK